MGSSVSISSPRCDLSLWNARLRCRRTGFCLGGDRVAYVSTTKGVLYSQQSESQSFVILVSRRGREKAALCPYHKLRALRIHIGWAKQPRSLIEPLGLAAIAGGAKQEGKREKMCASSAVIDRLSSEMVLSNSLISH